MRIGDDEREFRLRPRKPPVRLMKPAWSLLFKSVMHHARMTRNSKRGVSRTRAGYGKPRPYMQGCAVRIMYSRNAMKGQWRAHGRYVARESASKAADTRPWVSTAGWSLSIWRGG